MIRFNGRPAQLVCALLMAAACAMSFAPVQAGSIPSGPNVQITDTGLNRSDASSPDIALVGNTVYATWMDERFNSNNTIFFAKSTDGGTTWGANVQVSPLPADDWVDAPTIAVQPNGTIWIVWYRFYTTDSTKRNDVRVAFSKDGGQTFSVGTIIGTNPDNEDRWKPQIAVDASTSRIYILWRSDNGTGYDLSLAAYDANGANGKTVRVNDVAGSGRRKTDQLLDDGPVTRLIASNGVICAAWEDSRSRFAIYGACSTDAGASFGANFAISGADAATPRIALGPDGALYGSYTDSANQRTITLRRSADRGATWGPPRTVASLDTALKIYGWDLAIDANGQVVLPWAGGGTGFGGSGSLWLTTSVDQGQNFASTKLNDLQGQYASVASQYGATVVVGGTGTNTKAYVAWSDDRNTQPQIWFARADLDGVPPTAPGNLRAIGADNSNLLVWDAASDATGIQGYRVLRATASSGPYSLLSPLLVTGTSYRDVGIDATPYFYTVVAIDGTGNTGPASNEASATAQVGTAISLSGTIAYEAGTNLNVRNLPGLDGERTLGQGRAPRFSRDGQRLFYLNTGIQSRSVAGGAPASFYPDTNVSDFALAADEQHFGATIFRQFASSGPIVFCSVSEPSFGTPGAFSYTDDYNLSDSVGVSASGQWLVYRYSGFCNTIAAGTVSPASFCIVNTTSKMKNCLQGVNYRDADFAPSGDTLAFIAKISGQDEVWKASVQPDGSLAGYMQLTRGPAGQPAQHPSWSSDGTAIIFQRGASADEKAVQTLYTVRADGGSVRNLGITGSNPAWYGGGAAPSAAELPVKLYVPVITRR